MSLPGEILEELRGALKRLRERCPDARMYLFGSYARGDWIEDSDVDIVLVSDCFNNMEFENRFKYVRLMLNPKRSYTILAYTQNEFSEALQKSSMLQEISRYWIEIA